MKRTPVVQHQPKLHLQHLDQHYGRTQILHDLNLTCDGGVLGLLGPNGAGKTTLLRTIATLKAQTGGDLRILGCDPRNRQQRRQLRRRLGYLPQSFGYYPNFTIKEFVEYFAYLKEMPRTGIGAVVRNAINTVGLEQQAGMKLRALSGGMLRRAGIAQAIVNAPDLLLFDEPTAGLDPEQRLQFRQLLRSIGRTSTVIVSTHLVEDVAAVCTDVALIDAGKLRFHGTPDDLMQHGRSTNHGDSAIERGYTAILSGARVCGSD